MRHIPEAGAVCGNTARTDLRGGQGVTFVPTATFIDSCLRIFYEYEGTSHFQVAASSAKIGFGSQSETFFEGEVP